MMEVKSKKTLEKDTIHLRSMRGVPLHTACPQCDRKHAVL